MHDEGNDNNVRENLAAYLVEVLPTVQDERTEEQQEGRDEIEQDKVHSSIFDRYVTNGITNDCDSFELSLPESFDDELIELENKEKPPMSASKINTELLLFCNTAKLEISKLRSENEDMRQEIDVLKQCLHQKRLNISNLSISNDEYIRLKNIPEHMLDFTQFVSIILYERTSNITREVQNLKLNCIELTNALNQNIDATREAQLRSNLAKSESNLEESRQTILRLQANVLSLQKEKDHFDMIQKQTDESHLEMGILRGCLRDKEEALKRSEQERICLNDRTLIAVDEVAVLRNRNENLEGENKNLIHEKDQISKELQRCQKIMEERTTENTKLSQTLNNIHLSEEMKFNERYKNDINKVHMKHHDEVSELVKHFEEKHLEETTKYTSEKGNLEKELYELKRELDEAKTQNTRSNEKYAKNVNQIENELTVLRKERAATNIELAKLTATNKILASDLNKSSVQIDYYRDQISIYEHELSNLASKTKAERELLTKELQQKSSTLDIYLEAGLDVYCDSIPYTDDKIKTETSQNKHAIFLEFANKYVKLKDLNRRLNASLKQQIQYSSRLQQKLNSSETNMINLMNSIRSSEGRISQSQLETLHLKKEKQKQEQTGFMPSNDLTNTNTSFHCYDHHQLTNPNPNIHQTYFGGRRRYKNPSHQI